MRKLAIVAVALGLMLGGVACKKDEKKGDEAAAKGKGKDKDKGKKKDDKASGGSGTTDKNDPVEDKPVDEEPDAPDDPAPSGDVVKLEWKAPAVGAKESHDNTMTSNMEFDVEGQKAAASGIKVEKRHEEVLEVSPEGFQTKIKVHYEVLKETKNMGPKSGEEVSPLNGKTYLVWAEGNAIKATLEDGGEVSPEELEELVDEYEENLGTIPGMAKLMLNKEWKPGEKVTLTAEDLAAMSMGKKMTPSAGTATLVGVDGGFAMFELEIEASMDQGKGVMTLKSKVLAKLDMGHMRPVEVKISGTMGGTVENMPMTGTVDGLELTTYE